jgi:hypothetical protein
MSAIDTSETRPIQSETDGDDPNASEFLRLKADIVEAERARGKWRQDAREWYDMVANHQWADEDERLLMEQHRPVVSFNRTAPMVKAVCGLEVNNRQSVVYLPRKLGASEPQQMITNAGKWVRDECYAEDEESEAFRDMAICGEGWTETRMDFDEDPLGKIVKERIDPLEMGVTKGASRSNYVDARMIYRIREMMPDDVRALLGLADTILDAALDAKWLPKMNEPADGGEGNKKDYPAKTRAAVDRNGRARLKSVRVVQCQYWMREPIMLVATQNDEQPQPMTMDEFAKFEDRAKQVNAAADAQEASMIPALPDSEFAPPPAQRIQYKAAQSVRKVFYQCFIGARILDRQPMKMGMFQFSAMTGDRDKKEKYFYGMVKDMMDPQRWSNKFLSQTMHHININAKGGLLAETDAFVNVKTAEKNWADPTKIVFVKPGSIAKNKIKERQAIPLPPGLEQLMTFAISSIRDVTGINLELLGQADREQAAILEQQRRQSAMTILATMFDSLRKYRKHDGKLLLHFIWLLPEGTLIRIVEQGEIQYVPLVKEGEDLEKYDIIIDQAPTSPDQKQYVWGITSQILQMNILPPQAVIELLKYSPYPESVVQEIRAAMGLDGKMPPALLQQQLEQAKQALQILEEELKKALEEKNSKENDEELNALKVIIEDYRAKTDRLAAAWAAQVKAAPQPGSGPEGAGATEAVPLVADIPSPLEEKVDMLTGLVQQVLEGMLHQKQEAQPPEGVVPPPMAGQTQEQPQ